METGLQIAFAIQFAVVGVAHMWRPDPLIEFFRILASKGEAGVIVIAILSLCSGSFIVAFHNVWAGIPIILTVFGWAQLVKGTCYFLFPSIGLRMFERVKPKSRLLFRLPGIPFVILAALLAWHVMHSTS